MLEHTVLEHLTILDSDLNSSTKKTSHSSWWLIGQTGSNTLSKNSGESDAGSGSVSSGQYFVFKQDALNLQ